ncbi:MAG: rod shape-determining protein MreD [Candidatus Competibacterales bacterium]|nr:rod shape-determining protein MreD [Candidatus Competibacterales bacterium]
MIALAQRLDWTVPATLAGAFVLDGLPLPAGPDHFAPDWLMLVLVYWCLALPRRIGVLTGWGLGLVVDAARGQVLGQHALVYAVLAFLVHKGRQPLRLAPFWQQWAAVLAFLLIARLLLGWLDGMLGYPPRDIGYFAPLLGALVAWPLLQALLGGLRRRT